MNRLTIKLGILFLAILLLVGGENVVTVAQEATPTAPPQEVNFPALTGPYKVGITSFEWVDESRDETYASIPGLKRDLMVYIWFPASPAKRAIIAPYMQGDLMWNHWSGHPGLDSLIHSHAYRTNAIDPDKPSYPVLIFAPGLSGISLNYSSILEEIASHGYIVIGTSHPFSTNVITYPDGRAVFAGATGDDLLTVWMQDIHFVLDQAENLNATDGKFKGRLDLSRIGILGHSFGGAVAVEVAATDPRVKAGVSLDGSSATVVGKQPILFMGAVTALSSAEESQDKYWLLIEGSAHLTYGDFGLLLPLIPEISQVGRIDPARALQIINGHLVAFFNHYLNGSDLNWPIYDEAQLTTLH